MENFSPTLEAILLGYGISMIDGFLTMTDIIIVSHFTFLQQHKNQIIAIFWMGMNGTIISLCVSLAIEEQTIPTNVTDWILMFGNCTAYGLTMFVKLYVFPRLSGVLISLISSTSIIYLVGAQYLILYNIQPGNHNVLELCGVAVVLCGSIFPSVVKYLKERTKEETADTCDEYCKLPEFN